MKQPILGFDGHGLAGEIAPGMMAMLEDPDAASLVHAAAANPACG